MTLGYILIQLLDFTVIGFALASGWLWMSASRRKIRRVSKHENLDAADYNRIITALNRAQILNSRAALATGVAAMFAALRLLIDHIPGNWMLG